MPLVPYLLRAYPDPWITHAINEIKSVYGDAVGLKPKSLRKFGRTMNADDGVKTTVATFPGAAINEVLCTVNCVDGIVSDDAADMGDVTIEGHTIDGSGNLAFVVQTATLNGRTPVALGTPVARCSRIYRTAGTFASPATELVGNVYVYDTTDGATNGTPDTDAAVVNMIPAGFQQSEKCATSFSQNEYACLMHIYAGCTRGNGTAKVEVDIEYKVPGGVWRPLGLEISLNTAVSPTNFFHLQPYRVIPKNCDVRMVATSDNTNVAVAGRFTAAILAIT